MSILRNTITRITSLDHASMQSARERQLQLTKPPGSLGRLEDLSVQVAGIQQHARPTAKRKAVIIMAADHGVARDGVSAFPVEVTPQMVMNFLAGGAGINAIARQVGARVIVVDVGVYVDLPAHANLVSRKVSQGTASIACGPAMTREQAVQCIETGIEVLEQERDRGLDLVATGDMGIGNTTPSSAIVATITGQPVASVTGRGTGLDDDQLRHKIAIIERALASNAVDNEDGLDVLAKLGGYEIGGLAGVILGAAANRIPVVIDGFISGAAALIAQLLCPRATDFMIASHLSVEIGHQAMMRQLGLSPLLDLGLRLGEGTGAALAMPVIEAAVNVLNEMATFDEAGVTGSTT